MESFIRAMTDFLVNLGVDPDKALMVSGLGLVVIGFIAVALLSQLLLLPGQVKNKKRMKHLTGRAVGTILNGTLYTETENYGHQNGQTGETTTTHRYIVTYEFEVNGVTYRGQGEGSYAFWEKKKQKICYDPRNPEDNCTLFLYNNKTDTNILKRVFSVSIWVIILFAIILVYLFSK